MGRRSRGFSLRRGTKHGTDLEEALVPWDDPNLIDTGETEAVEMGMMTPTRPAAVSVSAANPVATLQRQATANRTAQLLTAEGEDVELYVEEDTGHLYRRQADGTSTWLAESIDDYDEDIPDTVRNKLAMVGRRRVFSENLLSLDEILLSPPLPPPVDTEKHDFEPVSMSQTSQRNPLRHITKGDLEENKTVFAFEGKVQAGLDVVAVEPSPEDQELAAERPDEGVWAKNFDTDAFQRKRDLVAVPDYVPMSHRVKRVRDEEEFTKEEKLNTQRFITWRKLKLPYSNIKFICIQNFNFQFRAGSTKRRTKDYKKYLKLLSQFTLCEVLILHNVGLQKLERLHLPNLLYVDIRFNVIDSESQLLDFSKRIPQLQFLNVVENPIARSSKWPQISKKLGALCPYLRSLNSHERGLAERVRAVRSQGTKKDKEGLPFEVFDWCFSSLDVVLSDARWIPENITTVKLGGLGLQQLCVGTLVNMIELDVSDNALTTLRGNGLERCDNLRFLNVASNRLGARFRDDCQTLGLIPRLREVILTNNRFSSKDKKDSDKKRARGKALKERKYRPMAIVACHHNMGTGRGPGLYAVDGVVVTLEERLEVLKRLQKVKSSALHREHWRLSVIEYYGHQRLRMIPNAEELFHSLVLPERELHFADVREFKCLEVIDLRSNRLSKVEGLENLVNLRFIDVSGNNDMDTKALVASMRNLTTLEKANISQDKDKHDLKKRISHIQVLSFSNERLHTLDDEVITINERTEALKAHGGLSVSANEYRFRLALTISAAPAAGRRYHPDSTTIGAQFAPEDVTELLHLSGMELSEKGLSFVAFTNLRRLDLSQNNITELMNIGLHMCPRLVELDLHNNKIKMELPRLAAFLETFDALEVICLRGNPCMKRSDDRITLISNMPSLRKKGARLRTIDHPITIHERVEGWRRSGGSESDAEAFRFTAAVDMRMPADTNYKEIKDLDLSSMELHIIDLGKFKSLERLNLCNNRIVEIKKDGLLSLTNLRTLDLRHNSLQGLDEILKIIRNNHHLSAIGLADNPATRRRGKFGVGKESSAYRPDVIKLLPELRQIGYRLRFLDDEEISADEIIAAWKEDPKERDKTGQLRVHASDFERFKFDLYLYRRFDEVVASKAEVVSKCRGFTDFELRNLSLEYVDFSDFNALRRLDLSKNRLRVEALSTSGLEGLADLQELDLRHNKIKSISIANILDQLRALTHLYIEGNSCLPDNSPNYRIDLLRRMPHSSTVGFPLKYLNGEEITVSERVEACEGLSPKETEHLRVSLLLEKLGSNPRETQALNLTSLSIKTVESLGNPGRSGVYLHKEPFVNLKYLDVSGNKLSDCDENCLGYEFLPNLEYLDLRSNHFSSLTELVTGLSKLNKLRVLFIRDSVVGLAGAASFETRNPKKYLKKVCHQMRGLRALDGLDNPFPLNDYQWKAVEHLESVAGAGPNTIAEMNLCNRGLVAKDFGLCLKALTELPVERLWANKGNPWQHVENYRFFLIYYLDDLVELDGRRINMIERANAAKTVKKLEKTFDVFTGKEKLANLANRNLIMAVCPCMPCGGGDGRRDADDAEELNIDLNSITRPILASTGSLLTKLEILVNFLQIYGLILTFGFDWPPEWKLVSSWIYVFSFDADVYLTLDLPFIDYIKFGVYMLVPLVCLLLYRDFNKVTWRRLYVSTWCCTRCWMCVIPPIMILAVIVIGYGIDYLTNGPSWRNLTSGTPIPVGRLLTVLIVAASSLFCCYLCWVPTVLHYRKRVRGSKADFLLYWFRLQFYKKRISLFVLTIFYMPIAKQILRTFLCTTDSNGARHLDNFPSLACPSSIEGWHPIQWVALLFGILYILGIPLFFCFLISKSVRLVDLQMNRKGKKKDIKEIKQQLKKEKDPELKKLRKQKKKDLSNTYANTAKEYDSAQTYLFSAYERNFRFFKPVIMVEKLLIVAVALYFYGTPDLRLAQMIVGNVVVGLFAFFQIIFRPFNDGAEDIMDTAARVTNTLNVSIGILLTQPWMVEFIGTVSLFAINGTNLAVAGLALVANPLRSLWANRQYTVALKRAVSEARAARALTGVGDAMGNTLRSAGTAVAEGVSGVASAAREAVAGAAEDVLEMAGDAAGDFAGDAAGVIADGLTVDNILSAVSLAQSASGPLTTAMASARNVARSAGLDDRKLAVLVAAAGSQSPELLQAAGAVKSAADAVGITGDDLVAAAQAVGKAAPQVVRVAQALGPAAADTATFVGEHAGKITSAMTAAKDAVEAAGITTDQLATYAAAVVSKGPEVLDAAKQVREAAVAAGISEEQILSAAQAVARGAPQLLEAVEGVDPAVVRGTVSKGTAFLVDQGGEITAGLSSALAAAESSGLSRDQLATYAASIVASGPEIASAASHVKEAAVAAGITPDKLTSAAQAVARVSPELLKKVQGVDPATISTALTSASAFIAENSTEITAAMSSARDACISAGLSTDQLATVVAAAGSSMPSAEESLAAVKGTAAAAGLTEEQLAAAAQAVMRSAPEVVDRVQGLFK